MLRMSFVLGSALLLATGCSDDGSDDDANDTGAHATEGHATDDHASETGEDGASGSGHDDGGVPPACGDLSSMCHDLGVELGGMYAECHDIGHDADEAACEAAYDECIALCTGAGTAGDGSTGGGDSSGGADTGATSTGTSG